MVAVSLRVSMLIRGSVDQFTYLLSGVPCGHSNVFRFKNISKTSMFTQKTFVEHETSFKCHLSKHETFQDSFVMLDLTLKNFLNLFYDAL